MLSRSQRHFAALLDAVHLQDTGQWPYAAQAP
jgi:hypothetical protein